MCRAAQKATHLSSMLRGHQAWPLRRGLLWCHHADGLEKCVWMMRGGAPRFSTSSPKYVHQDTPSAHQKSVGHELESQDEPSHTAGGNGAGGELTRWSAFCSEWNDTLARRPVPMVIFFGAAGTLTWGVIFGMLSCNSVALSALAMPEYAVGWLLMRTTVRLRMPLNVALAAPLAAAAPALSKLKISPLLASFAADTETRSNLQKARRSIEESPSLGPHGQVFVKKAFKGLGDFIAWAEGPIDKYGLPYFIAAKCTSVATLGGATAAAFAGLDVPGMLMSWGFSGELQSDAGLFAAAAALNVLCTPLHFLGSTRTVIALEDAASHIWRERQRELQDLSAEYRAQRQQVRDASVKASDAEKNNGNDIEDEEELTEAEVRSNLVQNAAIITLVLDLLVMVYVMRRLAKSSSKAAGPSEEAEDSESGHEPVKTSTDGS